MSLRVWLPLNGTLENKGLDDIAPVLTGAVAVDNEGKIGKCYKFGTATGRITVPPSTMTSFSECSVAFWVYILGWQTNWDTFFQAGLGSSPWNNYTFGVLRNSSNHVVFAISDGSTSSQGNYKSSDLALNTWHHLTFTYKTGHCCIYINGVLFKDYTTTIVPKFSNITYVSIGQLGNAGSYQTNCKMNDIRIYDHCLSPLEVKHIAQGLILHYPLNRNGWGQENLVNNSDFSNLATTGTVIRDETVLFHGHPTCKISRTGATSNTYTGWSSQDLLPRLTPGTKVTASVWVYRESTHEIDSGCEWRMYQRYNNGTSTDWTGFYFASDWPIGEWKRFTHTYTVRSDISGAFLNFNVVKNGTYWLAEPKVEIGEKATNWSPSVTDALSTIMGLNETIEYDCSGYCNNGTRIGTFSWTSDTPKYSVSMAFEKGIISIPNSFVTTVDPVFSISLWFKLKSGITYTAYTDLISFSSSSYSNQPFRLELCGTPVGKTIMWFRGPSGQSGGFAVKSDISTDEWYHTVLVSEGNKQYSYYINGEKLGTYNGSANSWTPTGNVSLGENINGVFYESDFRVYVTALSAEDVKSLYQNSAYIDNYGNIYGAIYEEV